MRKYKALIVEDKEEDLKRLMTLLKDNHSDSIEIVATASTFDEAVHIFSSPDFKSFDVSILDYKLDNNKDIFDLFTVIADRRRFGVIALTSTFVDELPDAALNIHQCIPFTKMHTKEKVAKFVLRLNELIQTTDYKMNTSFTIISEICKKVIYRDIYFFEAKGRYCNIHCSDAVKGARSYLHFESMGEVLEKLDQDIFFNSHRSYIINVPLISHCKKDGRGAIIYYRKMGSEESFIAARASQDGRAKLVQWEFMDK